MGHELLLHCRFCGQFNMGRGGEGLGRGKARRGAILVRILESGLGNGGWERALARESWTRRGPSCDPSSELQAFCA
jgi:hypothetical protein